MLNLLPPRMNPILGFDDALTLFTSLKGLSFMLSILLTLLGVITLILRVVGRTSNMFFQAGYFIFQTLWKIVRFLLQIITYPFHMIQRKNDENRNDLTNRDDDELAD